VDEQLTLQGGLLAQPLDVCVVITVMAVSGVPSMT
jgi:hypothetical protein